MKNLSDGLKSGLVILCIEDDEDDFETLAEALKKNDPEVKLFWVKNGVEGLNYLYREKEYADPENSPKPHLIYLDMKLPLKNGLEVCEVIKNDANLKMIPVIFVTTSSSDTDVLRAYKSGANSYIRKPVRSTEIEFFFKEINHFISSMVLIPE